MGLTRGGTQKPFEDVENVIDENKEIIYVCDLCVVFHTISLKLFRELEKISYENNLTLILCLDCFDNINNTMTERICGPATPESLLVRNFTLGCGEKF